MAIFDLEVDVVRERNIRPWKVNTHFVSLFVEDQDSWIRMEIEARNLAVWMVWHVRGDMVTAARIVSVEV